MQHDLLVLLEEFVRELGDNLKECDVGRRARRIVGILHRRHGEEDSLPVQLGHGLAVLQGVQTEGQGEPRRESFSKKNTIIASFLLQDSSLR